MTKYSLHQSCGNNLGSFSTLRHLLMVERVGGQWHGTETLCEISTTQVPSHVNAMLMSPWKVAIFTPGRARSAFTIESCILYTLKTFASLIEITLTYTMCWGRIYHAFDEAWCVRILQKKSIRYMKRRMRASCPDFQYTPSNFVIHDIASRSC